MKPEDDPWLKNAHTNAEHLDREIKNLVSLTSPIREDRPIITKYQDFWNRAKQITALFRELKPLAKSDRDLLWNRFNTVCREVKEKQKTEYGTLESLSKQQVAELMAAGDIFVLPSSLEAFGLAALEAAATGTAVVCSNAGGIPEVFQDGVNALLYSPGNTADMAGAMVRMIQDQELRRQLSASGAIVAHQLTWEVCANRTIRIYEEALHDYQSRRLHR